MSGETKATTSQTIIKWVSIAGVGIGLLVAARFLPLREWTHWLETWIESLGFWGPAVFVLVYILATVLFIPGSLLTLAAGALFGLGLGFVLVSIGSVIGAALAFLIARYFARSKVEAFAKSNPKFAAVDKAVSQGGWKIVGLLRLSPAIPFNWQNYFYGLTSIKFWPYVLTSWIAMMPGTFLYVYLGNVAGAATAADGKKSPAQWVLLGVGLIATIAVTWYVTQLAKKNLDNRTSVDD